MGRTYDEVDETIGAWIARQPMFFVATAPLQADGHINVSPKGGNGTLRKLGPRRFAFLDLVGSGIETVAHLRENGRIVLMFCAFEGPPKVLRLHGTGRVLQSGDPDFQELLTAFDLTPELELTLRSIIDIDVTRISDSCGFGVPRMEFVEERRQLVRWALHQRRGHGDEWKTKFVAWNNLKSLDGLPGMDINISRNEQDESRLSSKGKAL